jgi:hypothetical protein
MIYHREKLNNVPDSVESAVVNLYKGIPPHDLFIVATDANHVERMKRMEAVGQCSFSKSAWIKAVNKNEGVIFTITSGMFRRKHDALISAVIDDIKNESDGLTIDIIENPKFAVYFIGMKAKKAKDETETPEPTNEEQ